MPNPKLPPASIEQALGNKYKPDEFEYVLVRHARVGHKAVEGWGVAGEVKDATADPNGTLVVMSKAKGSD